MKTNLQPTFDYATKLFEQGNYDASAETMLSLIHSGYEVATCTYYIGLINLKEKRYDKAVEEFLKCLTLDPININCLYYLGITAEEQKNKHLAFHYYHKVLIINPDHNEANLAVNRLIANQHSDSSQDHLTDENKPHSPLFQPSDEGQQRHPIEYEQTIQSYNEYAAERTSIVTSLYDQLLEATDEESQLAVKMIQTSSMSRRRPRLSAFFELLSLGVIVLPLILTILYLQVGFPFLPVSMYTINPKYRTETVYTLLTFLCLICTVLIIKSTSVTIEKGYIKVKRGILFRNEAIYYIHKIKHFDIHRSYFNALTGDGTFIFHVEMAKGKLKKVKLNGLCTYKEMRQLKNSLLDLCIQLRNTPVIKSGLYDS